MPSLYLLIAADHDVDAKKPVEASLLFFLIIDQ
jgi:hypothetical protein